MTNLEKARIRYPIGTKYYPLGYGPTFQPTTAVRFPRPFDYSDDIDVGVGYVYRKGEWARKEIKLPSDGCVFLPDILEDDLNDVICELLITKREFSLNPRIHSVHQYLSWNSTNAWYCETTSKKPIEPVEPIEPVDSENDITDDYIKKLYPVGTRFNPVNVKGDVINEEYIVEADWKIENAGSVWFIDPLTGDIKHPGYMYKQGCNAWARIIINSEPYAIEETPQKETSLPIKNTSIKMLSFTRI